MRYQLVLQWSSTSDIRDYDALIEIENLLLDKLGKLGKVDGHDAGSGEMNIFILTDDPRVCFEQVNALLQRHNTWASVRVAYREISENEYVILYPKYLTKFEVV